MDFSRASKWISLILFVLTIWTNVTYARDPQYPAPYPVPKSVAKVGRQHVKSPPVQVCNGSTARYAENQDDKPFGNRKYFLDVKTLSNGGQPGKGLLSFDLVTINASTDKVMSILNMRYLCSQGIFPVCKVMSVDKADKWSFSIAMVNSDFKFANYDSNQPPDFIISPGLGSTIQIVDWKNSKAVELPSSEQETIVDEYKPLPTVSSIWRFQQCLKQ
jgi:hypothetical protein